MFRNGLNIENEFLNCWRTKDDRFPILQKALELHISSQKIGKKRVEINWIFNKQAEWFFRPDNIILCKKMSDEFFYFTSKNGFPTNVGHLNTTTRKNFKNPSLSPENESFVREFYKEDFIIWNYWSQVSLEERLNIDWSKHENPSNRL